jgi:hypothetical protein
MLSKDGEQRSNGPLTRSIYQRGLDPLVIARHQFLGVGMQIYLLVYPTLRWAEGPTRAPDRGSSCALTASTARAAAAALMVVFDEAQQFLLVFT